MKPERDFRDDERKQVYNVTYTDEFNTYKLQFLHVDCGITPCCVPLSWFCQLTGMCQGRWSHHTTIT